jgi:hypothetical protein
LPHLLVRELRNLISEHSDLKLPLAPWESMFGEKEKTYYLEEKQRTLAYLETLRAQERVQQVSTTLVLQLLVCGWSLRNRLQCIRDRDIKSLLKTFEETALNYGYSSIWHEKRYNRMLERLASLLHLY